MPDIKLFISCHKPNVHVPKSSYLYPIQVGAAKAERRFAGMLHDDEGDNISERNGSYCEATGQYWAWKNVKADYYGFMHYRRYFSFADKELPIHHEPFIFGDVVMPSNRPRSLKAINFNDAAIESVVPSYDFIATSPTASPTNETIYEQYRNSAGHHIEDLDTALEIVRAITPDMKQSIDEYMNSTQGYFCNMFVMPAELFNDYSSWLFSVLEELEKRRDFSMYAPVDARVTGYIGERLCGLYLYSLKKSGLSCRELQRVYFRCTDEERSRKQIAKDALGW